MSIFVVGFDEGKWNIDKDSSENNLLTVCACDCCWLNWISASSIEDDVDDEVDDDDWRFVDELLVVDDFVGTKPMKTVFEKFYRAFRWKSHSLKNGFCNI